MHEKLIELVRNNPCLYDTNDKNYKNNFVKGEIWQRIALELCSDVETIKQKWRSLRDSFVRYKKLQKGSTGQPFKQFNRHWSQQMEFLSPTLVLRDTISNVFPDEMENNQIQWNVSSQDNLFCIEDDEGNKEGAATSNNSEPCSFPRRSDKRKKKTGQADVDEALVSYLADKKSKKVEKNSVDSLFESYAETFKKFSPRNQVKVKLQLAKLFSDVEMEELEERNSSYLGNICDGTQIAAEQLVYLQNLQ